ncbi:MAG: PepSY domain-containing protein [Alphaproteobacteria bacterium]|nr:PepSY domain-containing protein [Alphaproteobacteria bacterium]
MTNLFRRLHRWLTLLFALPLLAVIGTGLVLSFEPLAQQARPEKPIALSAVSELLKRFDPQGASRSLSIRTMDNVLTIGGAGRGSAVVIDLRTGEPATEPQRFADFLLTMRRMHETLLLDLGWVVTASTFAMLAIASLGLLMGWPRFRNSLSGWHQSAAWIALPLIVISPLTGLALVYGVTFTPPSARGPDTGHVAMADAVRLVAADHDLANLTSIRQRGRTLMARIYVGGELRGFRVTATSLQPLPRNWPRVIHEGNWGGFIGPVANVVTSAVLLGLLGTGLTIWFRRTAQRFRGRRGSFRSMRAAS